MEGEQTLAQRFGRFRKWIALREERMKNLDNEVLSCFQVSDIAGIQKLMQQKEVIRSTNKKLTLFIAKWESQKDNRLW